MATDVKPMPERTVGRLSLYRRLLGKLAAEGHGRFFSHELAEAAGVTAAQVRRDFMALGSLRSSSKGYGVQALQERLSAFLDPEGRQPVALVGVGNLGRALLSYLPVRRPRLRITAAFDSDPDLCDRVTLGCRCHPVTAIPTVIPSHGVTLGIIAVPADAAQAVARLLTDAGVCGLLNFAPVPLRVPPHVYVEDMDIMMSLDKVAYFARQALGESTTVAGKEEPA